MNELIKAIFALYAGVGGGTLRTATPGGMWLSQAPQQASGAYIVVTPVAAPVSYVQGTNSTKNYTQDCDVQLMVSTLAGTATDIVGAMNAIHSLFDFCALTMTGYTLLAARRLSDHGPIRDDDTRGYAGYVEYRFTIGS